MCECVWISLNRLEHCKCRINTSFIFKIKVVLNLKDAEVLFRSDEDG